MPVPVLRFAADERAGTTLVLWRECFEVPGMVLADRMGCLKDDVVVPAAEYVRFAGHYGFRPDLCQAAARIEKGSWSTWPPAAFSLAFRSLSVMPSMGVIP